MRYGMEESLGHVAYDTEQPNLLGLPDERRMYGPRPSEHTAERIDDAVAAILDQAFVRASDLLRGNRDLLCIAAAELMNRETLDEAALVEATKGLDCPAPEPVLAYPAGPEPARPT